MLGNQWHPGQPRLVEFVIKRPEAEDTAASVANIATLAGAGYRAPDEQVTELTGLDVTTTQQPAMGMMQPPGNPAATPLQDLHTRYAPTMLWPPAREVFDARVRRDLNALTQLSAPAPARQPAAHDILSQTALQHRAAAYEKILMDAVLAGRAQGAAEIDETTPKTDENEKSPETPLERADTAEPPNHPQNENKRFCNSFATGLRADFENASESDDEDEDEEVYFEEEDEEDDEWEWDESWGDKFDGLWSYSVDPEEDELDLNRKRYGRGKCYKKTGPCRIHDGGRIKNAFNKLIKDQKGAIHGLFTLGEFPVDFEWGTEGMLKDGHYSDGGFGVAHFLANHYREGDTDMTDIIKTITTGKKSWIKSTIVNGQKKYTKINKGEMLRLRKIKRPDFRLGLNLRTDTHLAVFGLRGNRLKFITMYKDER